MSTTLDHPTVDPARTTADPSDPGLRAADLAPVAAIGWKLVREALWDGARCNWVGASMELRPTGWQAVDRTFGPDLYAGTAGVAVFLARAYEATGEAAFARTAAGALEQLLSRAERLDGAARHAFYAGRVGALFAAHDAGRRLGHGPALDWADRAVRGLLDDTHDDAATDLIGGAAGAIGALLSIDVERDGDDAAQLAQRYGERLLDLARMEGDALVWDTLDGGALAPLCGLGHGAAGIAWSLLELAQVTGNRRFRAAGRAAHAYERSHFDADRGNWPDLRDHSAFGVADGERSFGVAWCHGAVGIGLARARAAELDPTDHALSDEYEVAARTTAAHLHAVLDAGGADLSPCHGLSAGVELIAGLGARRVGVDPRDAVARFRALGAAIEAEGRPWPCGVLGGGEAPGLMLGLAGIGHSFLRLAEPARFPSLLLVGPARPA